LRQVLRECRPNIFGDEALVCPGDDGGFLEVSVWRRRVFANIARKVVGRGRTVTPHTLRHTYASIHISRGTNLLWVQRQGGWQSPTVLLSTYAHFLPTELTGFADVMTAQNGPRRPQSGERASVALA
jgi:integrase